MDSSTLIEHRGFVKAQKGRISVRQEVKKIDEIEGDLTANPALKPRGAPGHLLDPGDVSRRTDSVFEVALTPTVANQVFWFFSLRRRDY